MRSISFHQSRYHQFLTYRISERFGTTVLILRSRPVSANFGIWFRESMVNNIRLAPILRERKISKTRVVCLHEDSCYRRIFTYILSVLSIICSTETNRSAFRWWLCEFLTSYLIFGVNRVRIDQIVTHVAGGRL